MAFNVSRETVSCETFVCGTFIGCRNRSTYMVLGLRKIPSVFRALCFTLLFFGCTNSERDNPDDAEIYSSSSSPSVRSSSQMQSLSSSSLPLSTSSSSSVQSSGSNSSSSNSSISSSSSSSLFFAPSSSSFGSGDGVVYGIPVTYGSETYQTVVIGTQTWFARNLNYDSGSGTSICYNNEPSYCDDYGRLYDWETAMTVCPSGWHLPNNAEWDVLGDDAKKLKATSGWYDNGNGTNDYGFSALPGGGGHPDGFFNFVGYDGMWW